MAEEDSLVSLQGLHRDLCALIDLKLPVLDRLVNTLENSLDEFRALLDKKGRNDASRQTLSSGKIKIGEDEYEVNQDFQATTLQLAELLDVDELEAAALFMGAQHEAEELDRSQLQTAVIRFHRRREYLLLCLRLVMKTGIDNGETELEGQDVLQKAAQYIVGVEGVNFENAHRFWAKCLRSMEAIEAWLFQIAELVQRAHTLGQSPDVYEILDFERESLTRQHENLAAICAHMIKVGFASLDNYKTLLAKLKTIDRHDLIAVHYVPMTLRLTAWVALESNTTTKDARALHDSLMAGRENDTWLLRNFHAAVVAWWLAEYSGRYVDPNVQDPDLQNVNFDQEAQGRLEAFMKALTDGAFHFMLSISQDVRPTNWYDPTKTSMISNLLQDTAVLPSESPQLEEFFREITMEQMQTFVDSFITNTPDTLRKLKVEEDDQRRRMQTSFSMAAAEQPLHLERFLLIVSYAYDGFPDAAEDFWSDKESNLYGFLQWAAKRQPTPRIAMFCEMLRSISTGEANAEAAHHFLMEEGGLASGKIRRTSSLCYTHIFNELIELESHVREPKKAIQGGLYPPTQNPADQIAEPETATMLESYLRLLAHLCRESQPARHWLLHVSEFNLVDICLGLCADSVESHLRASAFGAVSALLVDKNVQRASVIWNNLDEWTVSGFHVASKQPPTIASFSRDDLWDVLANGYDESLAFMRLLHSLIEPYPDNQGLNDSLPFPEALGSTRRMPGIEKYVDFAMQRVFAERTLDVQQPLQRHVLTWACLRFIVTCLSTFNENLVIFANKSSIPVDAVIDTSSLEVYILLHPFTRVMEWLFNDKVLKALFASSHHDVKEVDAAPSDSPLVQSLMLSIEVMDLVMNLQATYIDIVRPVVKQQSSFHRSPISNLSLASFEDAVINNLQIIVDLGLYCGTGHEMLTIASLQLLQKLASSRKLAITPGGFGQRSSRSKIVGVLEKDNEAERISRSLANLLQFNEDELEAGVEAPGYVVKMQILDFLNGCIGASPGKPTIAHILLGFVCDSTTVGVKEDSLWNQSKSLFHAVLLLGVEYPDIDGETFSSWKSEIKVRCWDIMQKLWMSPLTSSWVMKELREQDLIFAQAPALLVVAMDTLWDGLSLAEGFEQQAGSAISGFFCGSPSAALQNFLQYRAAFLDYEARELRLAVQSGMSTLKTRIQSVLLGTTMRSVDDAVPNPNIFELFDFIEFSFPERNVPTGTKLLQGMDLKICQEEKDGVLLYSLPLIEQLLLLKIKAFRKERPPQPTPQDATQNDQDELQMVQDAQHLLALFTEQNRRAQLTHYHQDNLRSWVQLLTVTLSGCDFEPNARTSFILQTLQVIIPKLEAAYNGDLFMALQLASLADALILTIEFESTAFEKSKAGDFANDRLSQLFRAALVGIYSPISTVELRECCYQICIRYIHGTFDKSTKGSLLGRHTLSTVKNCGSHLLELICDDAYSGQGTCKVFSLLLLTALVAIATRQESKYILETFVSLNFIGVLVDNIKHIPDDLRAAGAPQVPMLLQYYDATLALLLRICQTRLGAAYVLNAGLFASIKQSGIFGVDPDIGLEFDNPDALTKYYDLMLSVLRVINAAVIARGRQNEQTIFQAREFLKESRHSMVAIFKRSVNVGVGGMRNGNGTIGLGEAVGLKEDLTDLVDCFTVLVDFTGFLEYEDSKKVKTARANMFS
ncbi:hypothetical protein K491DRAFT_781868 [Lophiostoma macrostomum CBS 122681]|uniref:Nuclear pore complex subunit Nup192 n=1 Tax=Lophiostoma macrostomum CBS 122681 TaxID=1314788 RepID=A0A6A6SY50_9PLEO|nr:hypothetical protein K491DRAFT_781868 [Lophiostoma macrostomum CBS 122681]